MTSLRGRLLLLGGAALLLGCSGSSSSSSHSMSYFYTSVSDPGQEKPQFYAVGYLDELPFISYDAASRRVVPLVPWMEKAEKEDPHYWDTESRIVQGTEAVFRADLARLLEHYNQSRSTGVHVLQEMYGCEVGPDGRPQAGYDQYGFDGEDFISLDKESLTWTARVPEAQLTKRQWESEWTIARHLKAYLEVRCVEWLWRYLRYGKEALQRRVPPTVKVARMKLPDGPETLTCRAHGFYPREIEVSWMKDCVQQQDILMGGVVPNSDGTYHQWVSIKVDPQDRDRYWCHVEHDGLPEPLDLAWEEPVNLELIVAILVGVLLAAAVLVGGVVIYIRREQESDTSIQVPLADA